MADLASSLDRIATMSEHDLRHETARLRGVKQMTTYKGTFIPKGGLQRKDEGDEEEKKKKLLLGVLGAVFAYFIYNNFL